MTNRRLTQNLYLSPHASVRSRRNLRWAIPKITDYSYCVAAGGTTYAPQAKLSNFQDPALSQGLVASPPGCQDMDGTVMCYRSKGEYLILREVPNWGQ
jgi:hypothetical protein